MQLLCLSSSKARSTSLFFLFFFLLFFVAVLSSAVNIPCQNGRGDGCPKEEEEEEVVVKPKAEQVERGFAASASPGAPLPTPPIPPHRRTLTAS
jgi:hypothetical protein